MHINYLGIFYKASSDSAGLGGAWEYVSKELQSDADTAGQRPPFK